MKDESRKPILMASMAFAERESAWEKEKWMLCRICVRDKSWWMPRWIYQMLLERLIIIHEFEKCVRCKCGEDMRRVIL